MTCGGRRIGKTHNIVIWRLTHTPQPDPLLAATTTNFTSNATWNTVASTTDPRGLVATWLYDAQGNLLQAVVDVGTAPHVNATSTWTYDAYGRVLTAIDRSATEVSTSSCVRQSWPAD